MADKADRAVIYARQMRVDGEGRPKGKFPTFERVSNEGASARARGIMSPKIIVTPYQRGIANLYGAAVERIEAGGMSGANMLQDAVDGGKGGSDGMAMALELDRQLVRVARGVLDASPDLSYRPRSSKPIGPHKPIKIRFLFDAVSVYGVKLEAVAKSRGWGITDAPSAAQPTPPVKDVPKQQSQKIKAALIAAIEDVADAWEEHNVPIPGWVGDVDVG